MQSDRTDEGRVKTDARPGRKAKWACLLAGLLMVSMPCAAWAARQAKGPAAAAESGDFEASRLLDKARELLSAGEDERGVKMLETIIEQYPASRIRYGACLELGRYYVKAHDHLKAVNYLANLKQLEGEEGDVAAADRELYLEGLYLSGTAYFQARNYGAAFPILRKITTSYPNTVWANQAYYYIGMCHFVQQNWSKAVESLNLVGTLVDMDAGGTDLAEAGRRFYVKVTDRDLSVLTRLGRRTTVDLLTERGDKEQIECIPMSTESDVLIGSIPTEISAAKPGDNLLQVLGGDTVTVRYNDVNAGDGRPNVPRETKVRIVSTAALSLTLGDRETPAPGAYLDQPLCVVLHDADLDTSDAAEGVEVKVTARYREASEEGGQPNNTVDLGKILEAEEEKPTLTRDELTVKLTELGNPPIRTGRFAGKIMVQPPQPDKPANPSDAVLTCLVDDEIVVTVSDALHLGGTSARVAQTTVKVIGEIDNRPRATQDVVSDPVVRARKNLVEAAAYLELARIFHSMGLSKGAQDKAAEGLRRVDGIIRTSSPIPSDLKQQAFKARWELQLAAEDFPGAMATCGMFNNLFPDSPLVDEAMMGIARIRLDNKQYAEAMAVLQGILRLPKSQAKAEAQFRIAEITESRAQAAKRPIDEAIAQYKLCAERYPESQFAGQSLSKTVDYLVDMRDYAQAGELLAQVFEDYPDAAFLDAMLIKWILVAYRSGDYVKAREKCAQLLFEYPESPYAAKAKDIMPRIEAKLAPQGGAAEKGS